MKMETTKLTAQRIKEFLDEGKRFDSRKPDEFRDIKIEKGVSKNSEGSVRVRIGKTEVVVGIKMKVDEPFPDTGDRGNIITMAEILPLSSERVENGPPKFNSIEIGRVIDRMIRESGFIDLKKLCIKEDEKVWTVFIDIYSVNDDGNLFDAAGIGAVAALREVEIPKYDEENDKVLYGESSGEKLPLNDSNPISITFHKIGGNILVDPTREEEDVSETRVTIGTIDGGISSMQKGAEQSLKIEEMNKILDLSEKMSKELEEKIKKEL